MNIDPHCLFIQEYLSVLMFIYSSVCARDALMPLFYGTSTCFSLLSDTKYLIRPLHIIELLYIDVLSFEQHSPACFLEQGGIAFINENE